MRGILNSSARQLDRAALTIHNSAFMQEVVEWDIGTWSRALEVWYGVINRYLGIHQTAEILDVGARDGGTALFFAAKGLRCICSDLNGPSEKAYALHKRYCVETLINYQAVDCTNMPFEDNRFDFVAFKSVLGGVGRGGNLAAIDAAFSEIHRVIKPGGILLFAENAQGSRLHQILRKKFVRWGTDWHYMRLNHMEKLLRCFAEYALNTYGFWGAFLKNNSLLYALDRIVCKRTASLQHYMCYGWAKKGE